MGSIPSLGVRHDRLTQIDGAMPRLTEIPPGCAFNPRCDSRGQRCLGRAAGPDGRRRRAARPAGCTLAAASVRRSREGTGRCLKRRRRPERRAFVQHRRPEALFRRLAALAGAHARAAAAPDRAGGRRRRHRDRQGRDLLAGRRIGLRQVHRGAPGGRALSRRPRARSSSTATTWPARRSRRDMAALRRRMQMIFQDPYASLNPRWRVFDIIAEPIRAFGLASDKADLQQRVDDLLRQVAADAGRRTQVSRTSSPAASASASRSPARWRASRSSWCATSPPRRSTSRCRRRSST